MFLPIFSDDYELAISIWDLENDAKDIYIPVCRNTGSKKTKAFFTNLYDEESMKYGLMVFEEENEIELYVKKNKHKNIEYVKASRKALYRAMVKVLQKNPDTKLDIVLYIIDIKGAYIPFDLLWSSIKN